MTVGGAALARHNGLVVFVDYGAPGDLLQIELIEEKKNLAFARLLRIIEPGPGRIVPSCSHFGVCGGCSWQHLSAKTQLEQKRLILQDALKEIQKIQKFEIPAITPSPRPYFYRNRVQMTGDRGRWAFKKRHSSETVAIENCELVEEPLQREIRKPSIKVKDRVRYDLRLSEDEQVLITALDDEVELVGFSQVNRFQNPELIEAVLKEIPDAIDGDIFELYAGSGNFTFPLFDRKRCRHLWAVEASPLLAQKAYQVIQSRHLSSKKLSFHLGAVEDFVKSIWPRRSDIVFLDPPRTGADDFTIRTLARSQSRQILYLSCHPVTLARDLQRLLKTEPRYQIRSLQAFEMFPQTDHVETLVSLVLE